jgi:hypothetical protein
VKSSSSAMLRSVDWQVTDFSGQPVGFEKKPRSTTKGGNLLSWHSDIIFAQEADSSKGCCLVIERGPV